MAAIVGAAGLEPTLAAVRRGAMVALANKECLVCAGALLHATRCGRSGAVLLPVDSEHNAIFQALARRAPRQRRAADPDRLGRAVPQPLAGARWRASRPRQAVAPSQLDAWAPRSRSIQRDHDEQGARADRGAPPVRPGRGAGSRSWSIPQSIVHSLVAFRDGSVLAQLGAARHAHPDRLHAGLARPARGADARASTWRAIGRLHFRAARSRALPRAAAGAARRLRAGGAAPTVLNAANEVAVAAFLAGRIGFLDIAAIVEATLERLRVWQAGRIYDAYSCRSTPRRAARPSVLIAGGVRPPRLLAR